MAIQKYLPPTLEECQGPLVFGWSGARQCSCEHRPEISRCFPLARLSQPFSRSDICLVCLLWLLIETKGLVRTKGKESPDSRAKAQRSWPGHHLKEAGVVVTSTLHVTSLQTVDGREVWQTSCVTDPSSSSWNSLVPAPRGELVPLSCAKFSLNLWQSPVPSCSCPSPSDSEVQYKPITPSP